MTKSTTEPRKDKWEVINVSAYQVWRHMRELESGEPVHPGAWEARGSFATQEEAQSYADKLNAEGERDESYRSD